jgi:aspartate aminotransferase
MLHQRSKAPAVASPDRCRPPGKAVILGSAPPEQRTQTVWFFGAAPDRIAAVHQEVLPELDFGAPEIVDASLSERVRGLKGSEILKIAGEIRELIAQGRPVCNLTVGDFDPKLFPIPAGLRERIRSALTDGETNYPPSDGMLPLRRAVAEFVAREWGVRYPTPSILIASGARPILYAAYRCVLNPGDMVVYSVPSWNNNHYAWISTARAVEVPTRPEDGFQPTVDSLRPHLPEARMVVVNSPLNPAGSVMTAEQIGGIAAAVVEENRRRSRDGRPHLFLLHDQVYASLVFGAAKHHHPVALVPEVAPWTISLDGISKALAATGLRVGWVMAPPPITARMRDFVGHMGAWAPRAEQLAVAGFLEDRPALHAFQREMNTRVQERLEALHEGFQALRAEGFPVDCVHPQGAIYLSLWLGLVGRTVGGRTLESNEAIRRLLLDETGLAIVPFQAFGLKEDTGWFRMSVGAVTLEAIRNVFPRLRRLFEALD